MTEAFVYTTVASLAGVLGAIAGRAIAVEGESRLMSVLAAAYVGAGAGLMCAVLLGSPLSLVAQWLNAESTTWFDTLDVASTALLWGTAAGAAGGMAIGVVVALLPLRRLRRP